MRCTCPESKFSSDTPTLIVLSTCFKLYWPICRYSGPTIHYVDEEYDTGRILAQRVVPVLANDTAEELAARVLQEVRHLWNCVAEYDGSYNAYFLWEDFNLTSIFNDTFKIQIVSSIMSASYKVNRTSLGKSWSSNHSAFSFKWWQAIYNMKRKANQSI